MSRPSKGARLYLKRAVRDKDGKITEKAKWIIRDGAHRRSTGYGPEDCRSATHPLLQQALGDYLIEKHQPGRERDGDPADIPLADVINVYLTDKAPGTARPGEVALRAKFLLAFFGAHMLGDMNGVLCSSYVKQRSTQAAARRELEDLRAAINHHRRQGYHRELIEVTLPPANPGREDFLTRREAATVIWSAYRYREVQKGHPTGRMSRKHIARFSLVAVYTGTRAGAICGARMDVRDTKSGFVDLDAGVFYRRPYGARETKKRKPPVRLPERLLAHLRRWKRLADAENEARIARDEEPLPVYVVSFNGKPVRRIEKAFKRTVVAAGLDPDRITPHIWRHTAATWLMQNGAVMWEAAGFLGMTVEMLQNRYGHHHPDFQDGARRAVSASPGQKPGRMNETEREHSARNVIKIGGKLPKDK